MSVAAEMVEEMSLSHDDAQHIAAAIFQEIFDLTHSANSHSRPGSGPRSVALSHCAGTSEASDAELAALTQHLVAEQPARAASPQPVLSPAGTEDHPSDLGLQRHDSQSSFASAAAALPEEAQQEASSSSAATSVPVKQVLQGLASKISGMGPAHSLSSWLGADPSTSPASVRPRNASLSAWLSAHPEALMDPQQPTPGVVAHPSDGQESTTSRQAPQLSTHPVRLQPQSEATATGRQTPGTETASFETATAGRSGHASTSPRTPERQQSALEGVDREALSKMLSASQPVDRRLPMQKLFEHLEVSGSGAVQMLAIVHEGSIGTMKHGLSSHGTMAPSQMILTCSLV